MRVVDWTIEFGESAVDVRVRAPGGARLGDVLGALSDLVGAPSDLPLWTSGDVLQNSLSLADPRFRNGARLRFGGPPDRVDRMPILSLHIAGGPVAGRVIPLERGRLTIGRAARNDLSLPDPSVSRRHAELQVTSTSITLRDQGSANGTWTAGRRVPPAGTTLHIGDIIRLGDSLLRIAGPAGPPASIEAAPDGSVSIRRSPRHITPAAQSVVALPRPDRVARPRGVQWLPALLPAAAGALIAWLYHQPLFLLFALLAPVMLISTALGDRLHWRRIRRNAAATLRKRRVEIDRRIRTELATEAGLRWRAAPDPAALRCAVALPDMHVWSRQRGDADLLQVRLGTADLPAATAIRDGETVTSAGLLTDVPSCIDLGAGPLGLAGPSTVSAATARWVVAQLAALCAPGDLELVFLLGPERIPDWHGGRWYPHLRGRVATAAHAVAAVVDELTTLVEQRIDQQRRDAGRWSGTRIVIVVDRPRGDELVGLASVLARGSAVGVTAVWLEADAAALPSCCAATVRVVGATGTRAAVRDRAGAVTEVVLDQVSVGWADQLARDLAPLVDAGAVGDVSVPSSCTLLDAVRLAEPTPQAVAARWRQSTGSARSTLGSGAGAPVDIDLARDGPHALVVGTTGSGKSELLRTMVAGLAANQSPDELNLLLIDYKGGATFAECAALPHNAGLVTDLDQYLTERALRSLHAELRRREQLFATVGVDDLAGYRSSAATERIVRLVIVVDEFATLATELPDFLCGLIGVAQRGRSLGVHLVLATQRPSAASAEIRANTALRIALRVTDPGDSQELLGSSVAATIGSDRAGRGYVLAGTLREFQAAYPAAVTRPIATGVQVEPLSDWRRTRSRPGPPQASDLARLVAAVQVAAAGLPAARSPWQPALPNALVRAALEPNPRPHVIPLGLVDLPDEQRQVPLEIDLAVDRSLLAVGRTRSGRTTALGLVALGATTALPPDRLHVHAVDPSGALTRTLRRLPHAGTVLGPAELHLVPRLLTRMDRVVADRLAHGAGPAARPPTLLLLIDGWDALCAGLYDEVAANCMNSVRGLLRHARAAHVVVVVSGEPALLSTRLAAGFALRLLLGRPDRVDPGRLRDHDAAQSFPPGRAIRCNDGAVLQLALPDTAAELRAIAERWSPADIGPNAIRIRPLPDHVRVQDIPERTGLALGIAGDQPAPVYLEPFAGAARLLVAGPPRSGRSTVLRLLIAQARDREISALVAAPDSSPLAAHAQANAVPTIGPHAAPPLTPTTPTLVLIDDSETFADTAGGERLTAWARDPELPVAMVAAARTDDLATSYRGVAAEIRRHRCGVLLRPGPLDGELLGVRLAGRGAAGTPPGRGVAVADPSWGAAFATGEPVPIQLATPDVAG